MPSQYDITRYQKLLAMYRGLLSEYLRQQQQWQRSEAPEFLSTRISILRGHILAVKGTLRGWKMKLDDHPDDQGPNDEIAQKVAHQRELLEIHRRNLSICLKQQSMYGGSQAPPALIHSLESNRNDIQRIKAILRGFGLAVDDLPEEELE